ncbi:hypothetical protein L1987_54248 [Smallanthus sonchifolius]|uniref:Uncharacterized protein n=1 Tax=Smallanthus sonchifolius TaxID=185202 RepID=A0ACB9E663_9ASTR|nr:hypothetical protein L1987_54248 [Smallanthus sonchifolius]
MSRAMFVRLKAESIKVLCDHKSGKLKEYGFVHFICEDSTSKSLAEMDGQKYPDPVCKQEITTRKKDANI